MLDAEPVEQLLLVRGEHTQESDPVHRGFLEIYADQPFDTRGSGRLELAEPIVGPANTLKPRLLVNRLWAYAFGRGIVPFTDNLRRLGLIPNCCSRRCTAGRCRARSSELSSTPSGNRDAIIKHDR